MDSPNEDPISALISAIQGRRVEEVKRRIHSGMDPTVNGLMPLRAAGDQSSIEIAELIYRWTEPHLYRDPEKLAVTKAFENAFLANHPEVAAFFLKKGASIKNVTSQWIQLAKERNWSELLELFVNAGVSAEEFLHEEKRSASRRLPPTSKDQEIRNLLHETLVNFGQLIRLSEGLIHQNISDPAEREGILEILEVANGHKSFLEEQFVDDELTLSDPREFHRLRSLITGVLQASAKSGALNNETGLRILVTTLQMELFKALSLRLYPN